MTTRVIETLQIQDLDVEMRKKRVLQEYPQLRLASWLQLRAALGIDEGRRQVRDPLERERRNRISAALWQVTRKSSPAEVAAFTDEEVLTIPGIGPKHAAGLILALETYLFPPLAADAPDSAADSTQE
jgi:hypothetical protein